MSVRRVGEPRTGFAPDDLTMETRPGGKELRPRSTCAAVLPACAVPPLAHGREETAKPPGDTVSRPSPRSTSTASVASDAATPGPAEVLGLVPALPSAAVSLLVSCPFL
jgi:hypothetical protein